MRLLFLCGSLDPGRDGVGDYTRTLGESCRKRGVEVRALALNDPEGNSIHAPDPGHVRLSMRRPWSARIAAARREIAAFKPDWISLQFVPYAFQRHGLAFPLHLLFGALPRHARRHIMFHETWITCGLGASLKRRLTSLLQRVSIRVLLRQIQPEAVHTSTAEYQRLLARIGARAELLPIFSSIPIVANQHGEWFRQRLAEAGVNPQSLPLRIVLFGTLYPEWDPEPLMSALRRSGRSACFISIGRLREGEAVWKRMASTFAAEHDFVRLGPLSADRVSAVLTMADLGVTPMPLGIIDKSSTTAAMLEHGLPVLVTRFDPPPLADEIERFHRRGIYPVTEDFAMQLRSGLPRHAPHSRLPEITHDFLARLAAASSKAPEVQPA